MLNLDFNSKCECQIIASDGRRWTVYPRLASDDLRQQIKTAQRLDLVVLFVALYNCSNDYVYEWHKDLQGKAWLNRKLTMTRRPGEYRGTQDVLYKPAVERRYSLAGLERLILRQQKRALDTP